MIGNDAQEKLSILSGTISRLDRNALEYCYEDGWGYIDFNTNYIQAAAAATGGSFGSPVVNIEGYAVALQAGGRSGGATTDYFLPLDGPLRALEYIRKKLAVARGTIQTQWVIEGSGVYYYTTNCMWVAGWLIQSVNHEPTVSLNSFIEVMKTIADRDRIVVTHKQMWDMHTVNTTVVRVDRHWCRDMRLAVRNDDTGLWDFTDLTEAPGRE